LPAKNFFDDDGIAVKTRDIDHGTWKASITRSFPGNSYSAFRVMYFSSSRSYM